MKITCCNALSCQYSTITQQHKAVHLNFKINKKFPIHRYFQPLIRPDFLDYVCKTQPVFENFYTFLRKKRGIARKI